jgi:hypothetical protein
MPRAVHVYDGPKGDAPQAGALIKGFVTRRLARRRRFDRLFIELF